MDFKLQGSINILDINQVSESKSWKMQFVTFQKTPPLLVVKDALSNFSKDTSTVIKYQKFSLFFKNINIGATLHFMFKYH